jgi:predicted RNase H-like nuclease (RuvC/YqgF family)
LRASHRQPREEDPFKPDQLERENERLSREVERLRQELIERDKKIFELERKLALRLQNSTTSSKPPSSDGLAGEQRPRGSRGNKVTVQVVDAVFRSDGMGSALRCDRIAVTR